MRPQETGIVELHDTKQNERGFGCMKLITFLTRDGEKEWERWHGAQKDRERITIGLILDVPPSQLTEEQIEDYKKKLWIESMRIPLFNPFKLK